MNREFLDLYNRELRLLYEQAKEFAEEYPGVAERLGGLIQERMDPMISGLLEGTAFLAARVQLKIKHEFPQFTSNLLEQLLPHHLAPTPSALLARIEPPYGEPNLKNGMRIGAGSTLEAAYVERERRVACQFHLTADILLWPFEVVGAEFFPSPGPLQALGLETGPEIVAGMKVSLRRRAFGKVDDEPSVEEARTLPETWFSTCQVDELPVHLLGDEAGAIRLYEMLFAHCRGIYFRHLDEFGDPTFVPAPRDSLQQIGFGADEALLPCDKRIFRGFDLLRELFVLPAKFLGFRLGGLAAAMERIDSNSVDVLFTFDQSDSKLAAIVRPQLFSLYTAPAVNLFELTTARLPVRPNEHEYHVVPDRSRYLDFEPHRILKVFAHFQGSGDKVEVYPLYSAPTTETPPTEAMFYTVRRTVRRRSLEERRYGRPSSYVGTDMFISLAQEPDDADGPQVAELSVRALCSNRHLTEHLPVGQGGADFFLPSNTSLTVNCVAGPTPPRESIVNQIGATNEVQTGTAAWRLINMLSLNHLGLVGRGTKNSAQGLREILSLFADRSESTIDRRIRGIVSIDSRPIVRRIRQDSGTGAARGLEITVTFDDKAFEGSGVFLLGAVLERFFSEYAPINNFVETVIRTTDRDVIMRWRPRLGTRIRL
jgi:type VI secretion system protein ImpG